MEYSICLNQQGEERRREALGTDTHMPGRRARSLRVCKGNKGKYAFFLFLYKLKLRQSLRRLRRNRRARRADARLARRTAMHLVPLPTQIVHLHKLFLVIAMPYFKRRRVRDGIRISILSYECLLATRERAADARIVPALERSRTARAVFRVVLRRLVLRGAHDAGEHAYEDEPEGRHAGADDADVDLDGGPVRRIGLVPGGVNGVCEGDEGLEADDGNNSDAFDRVSKL